MTLLLKKILSQMKDICKPQKNFLQLLFEAMLASHGKLNYRNLSRYSKMSERTISRNYRKEFNFLRFNELLIEEAGFDARRCVAVFDPSFIKKSGKKTDGLGKFWNGSNSRAERGLEIGCLAIVDVETKQSLTVAAKQTEPIATKDENRVDCYIHQIVESVSYIQKRVQYLVVDGVFL